jgi:non-specific serine/threonine protein kinase
MVEDTEPKLTGLEQDAWLDKLESEHGNIRAALEWCTNARSEVAEGCAEIGLRMAGALLWFWQTRGYLSEGRERLAVLLDLPGARARTAARSKALMVAGRLAYLQGDYESGRAMYEENLEIARNLGGEAGVAHALIALASADTAVGDYAAAGTRFEEALKIVRDLREERYTAQALVGLGEAMTGSGDYAGAVPLLDESLALFNELGDKRGVAFSLSLLGLASYHGGDLARAGSLYGESLAIRNELESKQGVALCLLGFAEIALAEGAAERAAVMLGAAQALLGSVGARIGVSDQARYETALADAKERLDPAVWDAAWQRGRYMNMAQAASLVMSI